MPEDFRTSAQHHAAELGPSSEERGDMAVCISVGITRRPSQSMTIVRSARSRPQQDRPGFQRDGWTVLATAAYVAGTLKVAGRPSIARIILAPPTPCAAS